MAEIALNKAAYCYTVSSGTLWALEETSLTIPDGSFTCVVGPSGCGKTTLLRLIAGLQPPTVGTVIIDGKPVEGPDTDRAMVFQNDTLFPWMTARKNVQFAARQARPALSRKAAWQLADDCLHQVGMLEFAAMLPHQMSGGMRQRTAIARMLAMDAGILLLDEPFGALDTKRRTELQALLESLWRNSGRKRRSVVFVTHDLHEALRLADRIVVMRQHRVETVLPIEIPRPRTVPDAADAARLDRYYAELLQYFHEPPEVAQA